MMSLYETMSRSCDSFPMFIPYVDGLPKCLQKPLYSLIEDTPETNIRGQVLLRPLFEKIKMTILQRDYGDDDDRARNPEIAANRCLALRNLINACKLCFFSLIKLYQNMIRVYRRFHIRIVISDFKVLSFVLAHCSIPTWKNFSVSRQRFCSCTVFIAHSMVSVSVFICHDRKWVTKNVSR